MSSIQRSSFIWRLFLPLSIPALLSASCDTNRLIRIVPPKKYPLDSLAPHRIKHPSSSSPRYLLKRTKTWSLTRDHLTDRITLFINSSESACKQIHLPKSTYPLSLDEQADGTAWLVSYNLHESSPSGKRPGITSNLIDIYQIKPYHCLSDYDKPISISNFSDIDTAVYTTLQGASLHLCAKNSCYTVSADRKSIKWNTDGLSDYEFVEVVFDNNTAFALLRKKRNQNSDESITHDQAQLYFVTLKPTKSENPEALALGGIPYYLRVVNGKPAISVAKTPSQLLSVYLFDLSRQGPFGFRGFAQNNLEGRVVWSQVYYLKSLINLQDPRLANLSIDANDGLRLNTYLDAEINSILTLCTSKDPNNPFFLSKRYSLDRAPLLFALHLGRIVDLLHRYKTLGGTHNVSPCLSRVMPIILGFSGTVEYLSLSPPLRYEIFYRKSVKFWADGANVPYNYTSGISLGLSHNVSTKGIAKLLMANLYKTEFSKGFPKVWRYWSGIGDHGWKPSTLTSINTPAFQGNNGAIAHITYRNMDAAALLEAYGSDGTSSLTKNLSNLVHDGLLLPSLYEYISTPLTHDSLLPNVARYYSRSTNVWELESQPWALSVLAQSH